MNQNKENPPPPKINLGSQILALEIPEKIQPKNKRRKSENFSALLEFFNAEKIPPTGPPQVGKQHQEHLDQKRPLKNENKSAFDDTLMPQESITPEKSHPKTPNIQKSNPPQPPLLKNLAVGKILQENQSPPPASASARPELRAKIIQKFKILGGKKPPSRPTNHIPDRNLNLAKASVIGSRPGVSTKTKTQLQNS